jgi:hypothetical protein
MIFGLWHPGSGVGDQIFSYLAARVTAKRLGVPFTMYGDFKGKGFITLENFNVNQFSHHVEMPAGKLVVDCDWPTYEGKTYYDPEFNFIGDNTIVDGCYCQDERYWAGYPIADWLQTEPLDMPDDLCVINFRGGEFSAFPDLFLPQSYWDEAIEMMKVNGFKQFQVHTDDPATANKFFPDFDIIHDVGLNWRSVRYAKGAIIANSAFGIIPRLLNGGTTIAPRYWARRNIKQWSTPQNYYPNFIYI